jgi:hypothetical protein
MFSSPKVEPITNNHGQHVVSVPYRKLGAWVREYNNARIVSLVSVNDGGYGVITSFIIVYEVEVPPRGEE